MPFQIVKLVDAVTITGPKGDTGGVQLYTNNEVKEKMKAYLLEETPDLALYFKTDSINKVLSDAIDKAFERVSEEHFKNRLVSITGVE